MTHQRFDVSEVAPVNNHDSFAEAVAREVSAALEAVGYENDLMSMVAPAPGSEAALAGLAVTPEFSEAVLEAKENGLGWMSVNEDLADYFGRSRGSSNVAAIAVNDDLTATDIIRAFAETGDETADQIQKGLHLLELMSARDETHAPVDIMAYSLFEKCLGIYAEKALVALSTFKKGNAAQDKGGIDLWLNGDPKQLKTVTRAASKGINHFKNKEIDHLFYGFAGNTLVVGDEDSIAGTDEVAGELQEIHGLRSKTIVKVSENVGETKDHPRPARVIWS